MFPTGGRRSLNWSFDINIYITCLYRQTLHTHKVPLLLQPLNSDLACFCPPCEHTLVSSNRRKICCRDRNVHVVRVQKHREWVEFKKYVSFHVWNMESKLNSQVTGFISYRKISLWYFTFKGLPGNILVVLNICKLSFPLFFFYCLCLKKWKMIKCPPWSPFLPLCRQGSQ